jgi:hypothetical protein
LPRHRRIRNRVFAGWASRTRARIRRVLRLASKAAQPQPQPGEPSQVNVINHRPALLQPDGNLLKHVKRRPEVGGRWEASISIRTVA